MKSILFIVHYFYPDYASTGQIMTELCRELQNDFKISVIAVEPGYSSDINVEVKAKISYEKFENMDIYRVKAPKVDKTRKITRIKHMAGYFTNTLYAILKCKKHDMVFAISQPPIIGGLLGLFTKTVKGSKFIYNIQDFNPEQIEAVGYSKSKLVIETARWLDNLSCRKSDGIVVVGNDMKETLVKRLRSVDLSKVHVINNWINEAEIYPLPKKHPKVQEFIQRNGLTDKFIIMYSGNIGLYYDLENVIKILAEFKTNDDVMFVFIGEGAKKKELMEYCASNAVENIKFLPYQPKEELVYSLNAADAHLVTNQKGIKGVSVPSKIYGVMASGKGVIGVLEKGSEAEMLIAASECGVCSEPQDYDSIGGCIKFVISNQDVIREFGKNGRNYIEQNLKMADSINKYKNLLNQM